MTERIRPTRSGLFAIELLIAVGVFTLCAVICAGVFVQSEVLSQDSAALVRAVNEARSAAECYKAAQGDLSRTAELFGGRLTEAPGLETWYSDSLVPVTVLDQAYDGDWNRLTASDDAAAYRLRLSPEPEVVSGCAEARLQVLRADGAPLLEWAVAAWEAVS